MIVPKVIVTSAIANIARAIARISSAPQRMQTAAKQVVQRLDADVRRDMASREPPEQPSLPFIWSYDPEAQRKARAWYFINRVPQGSSSGGYQRKHDLVKAYVVRGTLTPHGGVIRLENTKEGAEFVIGDEQVPSHAVTGWERIDDTAVRYSEVLAERLIDAWDTAADPFSSE